MASGAWSETILVRRTRTRESGTGRGCVRVLVGAEDGVIDGLEATGGLVVPLPPFEQATASADDAITAPTAKASRERITVRIGCAGAAQAPHCAGP
jgi:hypothetical protein